MIPQIGFASLFERRVREQPEITYFSFEGTAYTFGQVGDMVRRARAWLASFDTAPGDRVAVMMDSSPAGIAIILALAASGLTWVPINTRLRKDGLRYILEQSDPRCILADPVHLEALGLSGVNAADPRLKVVDDASLPAVRHDVPEPVTSGEDLFAIMYTSGTSGPPKGVMITQTMMLYAAEAVGLVSEAAEGDVMFVWEPFFHIGGSQMLLLPLVRPVVLAIVGRFSASRFWQQVVEAKATHIHYLGGILEILLSRAPSDLDRAHGVRIAWGGGCAKATWLAFEDRFGVRIRECYGMSEASSITTANTTHVVGSVGRALPWFDVQIVGENGEVLPAGETGEILTVPLAPGPVFAGYYRSEHETARALRDGRLFTGDLGQMDGEGNLYFLGRMSDSVRHKGENVSAWEVESVANKHEWVASSAMVGVPGAMGEQDILLYVQPAEGADFDIPTFAGWLAAEVAPYQMPRYIALVPSFERTPSERIMKHRLKPNLAACWDRLSQLTSLAG